MYSLIPMNINQLESQIQILTLMINQYKTINQAFYNELVTITSGGANTGNDSDTNLELSILNNKLEYLLSSMAAIAINPSTQQIIQDNLQYIELNDTLNKQLATNATTIDNLNAQIATDKNIIAANLSTINTLNTQNAADLAKIGVLTNTISDYQGQIASLTQQHQTDTNTITSLNQQITALEAQNTADNNLITNLNGQISTLKTQITTQNNLITSLNQQITTLKNQNNTDNNLINESQ